jgi:ATP-dependent helicase/nuclease subunit A
MTRDAQDRERAVTSFDCNVVVTAGAGTGKTTLLIDRLTHLLLREPHPLKITQIVALTFTNKAAHELKLRLRERLSSLCSTDPDADVAEEMSALRARYAISSDQIRTRVEEALRHLSRSEIGTIHSFAATLLRLYPIEAGCDPQFQEDDGQAFEQHFEQAWKTWLDEELAGRPGDDPVRTQWRQILRAFTLDDLRTLVLSWRESFPPMRQAVRQTISVSAWLSDLEAKADRLLSAYPSRLQNERLVQAARCVITTLRMRCEIAPDDLADDLAEERSLLQKTISSRKLWSEDDLEQARQLVRIAQRLLCVHPALLTAVCERLEPFIVACRDGFLKKGFISFDGLLVRARDLLRDFPEIREALKTKFQAMLIDELQDTDPVQYEILFFLAETPGVQAARWDAVRLAPGKLFVVGDPKQSIYAFRGADIGAYLRVIETIVRQGGIHCTLTTSFRSGPAILNVVNSVFQKLILPQEGMQPSYNPLQAARDDADDPSDEGVTLLCAGTAENSEAARKLEGERLADGLFRLFDETREGRVVRPGHVAILMRTLTHVYDYLEPLRLRKIPFVVEGEKHFYGTQEIVDAVNLLRAVASPADTPALVGLLRSEVGGLSDVDLYELHRDGGLGYQASSPAASEVGVRVRPLYNALTRLHTLTGILPVSEVVARIFEEIPILLLAARGIRGEQAVANLEKVRRTILEMGQDDTFRNVVVRLGRHLAEKREEAEGSLVEEDSDAVRILSVHKSKGLEFPIVVLAGAHTRGNDREDDRVFHDWSSGRVGLRVGEAWSLDAVFLAEQARCRAAAEQKRLLYVAMTRARQRLIISYAEVARTQKGAAPSPLAPLATLATLEPDFLQSDGEEGAQAPQNSFLGLLRQTGHFEGLMGSFEGLASSPRRPPHPPVLKGREGVQEMDDAVRRWEMRMQRYPERMQAPLILTPTRIMEGNHSPPASVAPLRALPSAGLPPAGAVLIGQLAHRFLQTWEYVEPAAHLGAALLSFFEKEGTETSVREELTGILGHFFHSPVYKELCAAHILGREVPLLMPWSPALRGATRAPLMEGVVDLIYEKEGLLYVADYKTDHSIGSIARYTQQARIYCEATERALQREVSGFNLIFLRMGEVVPIRRGS